MFVYPTNMLDGTQEIEAQLGNFFPDTYGGQDLVRDYLRGAAIEEQQIFQLLREAQDTLSRVDCPIFSLRQWHPLTLNQDDASTSEVDHSVSYPLPPDLYSAVAIADAFTEPNVQLLNGVDFKIDPFNKVIVFTRDPLANPSFAINNGEAILWLFRAKVNTNYLLNHVTSLVSVDHPQLTQNFKDMVNAILDGITGGTSYGVVARFISAVTDIPIVKTDGEVLQAVVNDAQHQLFITDQNVYQTKLGTTPVATVGDELKAGDILIDGFRIFEANHGVTPAWLTSVDLPPSILVAGMTGPLTFSNSVQALTVTENVSGFTKLTWPVGGAGPDVTLFFNTLHAKGVTAGATLANYLDLRPQPQATQPGPASLPTTINPMKFVIENVFRGNFTFVKTDSSAFGPNSPGIGYYGLLRLLDQLH